MRVSTPRVDFDHSGVKRLCRVSCSIHKQLILKLLDCVNNTLSARFLPRHHFAKYQQSGSGAKKLADEL